LRRGINIPIGDIEMKRNLFFFAKDGYEVMVDLDKATSIQKFEKRIVIHFGSYPDERFFVDDDGEGQEFDILEAYFDSLKENRLKLRDFMSPSRDEEREESIHHMKGT
jgi:hypothetical protein